jgi:hypothetical protein
LSMLGTHGTPPLQILVRPIRERRPVDSSSLARIGAVPNNGLIGLFSWRNTYIAGCKFSREHTRLCFALWRSCTKDESVLVEKCAIGWGSDDDEMRMSLGSFIRAIAGFTRGLCLHFISIFQQVAAIRKTSK